MAFDSEDRGFHAAAVLFERIVRDIYPSRRSSAIQPLQWSILRYLQRMPEEHCELRWIARYLGLTPAPVARALRTLETRGLVTQYPGASDSRTRTIQLTGDGSSALRADPIAEIAQRIRALPQDQRDGFLKSIQSLALRQVNDGHDPSD